MKTATKAKLKVTESLYKKYGVTLHFPTEQNLVKKILRKYKYWHYQKKISNTSAGHQKWNTLIGIDI